ncbi:hypothetical protein BDR26DRAFT_857752 [Obelidium mucronatum]|nr:hypothetical protein BDR26DRAFT_857752 [Obelidium mucronatum]
MKIDTGYYELAIQNDGNLVVYDSRSIINWSSHSNGRISSDTSLQYSTDGLIQMRSGGQVVWSLETAGSAGLFCFDTTNGLITMYDYNSDSNEWSIIWDSNSNAYGAGFPKSVGQTTAVKISPSPSHSPLLNRCKARKPKQPVEQLQPATDFVQAEQPTVIGKPPSLRERVVYPAFATREIFKASVSYHAQYDQELTIHLGDHVEVIEKRGDGWCCGRVGSGEFRWIHISKLELVG